MNAGGILNFQLSILLWNLTCNSRAPVPPFHLSVYVCKFKRECLMKFLRGKFCIAPRVVKIGN